MRYAQYEVRLPIMTKFKSFIEKDVVVPWLPFVGNFYTIFLKEHQDGSFLACEFLKRLSGEDSTLGMEWIEEFKTVVFY